MKCFYHSSDLDGHCSGAIIKYKHSECEMVPINYGEDFPWSSIVIGETVFMVDFSLPADDTMALSQMSNFIWIDHHKSAMAAIGDEFEGIREDGLGACALAWRWCFPNKPTPYTVQLLAEYDVWNHTNPDTLPFQYGIRIEDTLPGTRLWTQLFSGNSDVVISSILEQGRTVLRYQEQSNEMYAKGASFEAALQGHVCLVQNKMYSNSQAFDSVFDPDKHDIMLLFGWRHGQWTCSLYSQEDGPDVSKIAVSYGGGGHAHAAGFSCDQLPFQLK